MSDVLSNEVVKGKGNHTAVNKESQSSRSVDAAQLYLRNPKCGAPTTSRRLVWLHRLQKISEHVVLRTQEVGSKRRLST